MIVAESSHHYPNYDAESLLSILSDYEIRPKILPVQYSDYRIISGGKGNGTVVFWKLHATRNRIRSVESEVKVDGTTITEKDRNSTMVTTYTVSKDATGRGSSVLATTSWEGGGGVKGFFERTFAPMGVRSFQRAFLENVEDYLRQTAKPTAGPKAAETTTTTTTTEQQHVAKQTDKPQVEAGVPPASVISTGALATAPGPPAAAAVTLAPSEEEAPRTASVAG